MIADNIKAIEDIIAKACARSNRPTSDVTLVAVSKRKSVEEIEEAIAAGIRHFGENRIEEALTKVPQVNTDKDIRWHFVGHIQSRKARDVVPLFDFIHSVDSMKLAKKLSTLSEQSDKEQLDILLQVNVSGETSKSGFDAVGWSKNSQVKDKLWQSVQQIHALPRINLYGLMTMAPIVKDMEETRPIFAGLAALRAELSASLGIALPHLSMGMTDDYPIAIEEGATLVRVGRAIFGERD